MNYKREVTKGRQLSEIEEKELTKKVADYFIENDGYVVKKQDVEDDIIYYELYIDDKFYVQFNHNAIHYVCDFINIVDSEDFYYRVRTEKFKKRYFGLGASSETTTEVYYNFNTDYFTEYILSKIKIKEDYSLELWLKNDERSREDAIKDFKQQLGKTLDEYERGREDAVKDLKQQLGKILDENENIKGDMVLVELISLLRNFK